MAVSELTSDTFDDAIANGVVLVDFWAPWCAPCRALGPLLDQVSEELGDAIKFTKVNTQDEPELAARYNIMTIPAVLIIKDGEVVDQFVGLKPKPAIKEILSKYV